MPPVNAALEAEYNNRALVPEHPAIFERWQRDSAALREATRCTLALPYGSEPRQQLDLFHATNPRGTVVFIHGGYWRSLDKSMFSFVAKPFLAAGLSVAMINYRLCPSVAIDVIVDDCRQALAWLITNGRAHKLPVDRIALAGHSAGGHLVAMLYATDWQRLDIDTSGLIGGIALSGVYDLDPLLECSMNADLHLNHHIARANSPITRAPALTVPLHLAVGANESRAFVNQSQLLAQAWPQICAKPDEVENANHFTIMDLFSQAPHPIYQCLLKLFD